MLRRPGSDLTTYTELTWIMSKMCFQIPIGSLQVDPGGGSGALKWNRGQSSGGRVGGFERFKSTAKRRSRTVDVESGGCDVMLHSRAHIINK